MGGFRLIANGSRQRWWRAAALGVSALVGSVSSQVPASLAAQGAVSLRSGVTLVAVNVRASNAAGEPVVGLRREDFRLTEDGVQQPIAFVTTQDRRKPAGGDPPRQFVVVLGRGRLNAPARGLDAVIDMVRSKLSETDCVSVMAYFRLTKCTADRERVVRLLERARERHPAIESLLTRDETRQVGAPAMPLLPDTMAAIEGLFGGDAMPPAVALPGSGGGRALQFWEYPYVRRTLGYLRYLEGEKHIVLLTERGATGSDPQLIREATAARTTVTTVQTGGVRNESTPALARGGGGAQATTPFGWSLGDVFAPGEAAAVAVETGGLSVFYADPFDALTRLARITSYEYTVGYYPAKPPVQGEYRSIRVAVNRAKVVLGYRHGYEAEPVSATPLAYRRMFSEVRLKEAIDSLPLRAAASRDAESRRFWDGVRATAVLRQAPGGGQYVEVDIRLDAGGITFTADAETNRGSVELMVVARDRHQAPLGRGFATLDLPLTEADRLRVMRGGIHHLMSVPVGGRPWDAAVAVFEFSSDGAAAYVARVK